MADRFSRPRALTDPAFDITDVFAFPSPERPGHLVLVMNVFPIVMPRALFSDALTYRFRIRSVTEADGTRFVAGDEEWTFDVTFTAPVARIGGSAVQIGTCPTPSGAQVMFPVGDDQPTEAPGLRIFAGQRLDPFFIDLAAGSANHAQHRLTFTGPGGNTGEGASCLSIVLEFEVATLLGSGAGPLFAVAGETLASGGGRPVRLERMGRPEIKNFILQDKKFDLVNRDLELRYLSPEPPDLPTVLAAATPPPQERTRT